MKAHDIIIYLIIGIILLGQVYLFLKNNKRIKEFDKILPLQNGLETITVNIDAEDIRTIEPDFILKNLNQFSTKESDMVINEELDTITNDEKLSLFKDSDFDHIKMNKYD